MLIRHSHGREHRARCPGLKRIRERRPVYNNLKLASAVESTLRFNKVNAHAAVENSRSTSNHRGLTDGPREGKARPEVVSVGEIGLEVVAEAGIERQRRGDLPILLNEKSGLELACLQKRLSTGDA